REHNILDICTLNSVEDKQLVQLEYFKIEFISVTHSIADACAICIHSPIGVILHTGDFKVDYTPIDGRRMDLESISKIGKKGVLLLLADSTNVERKGHSLSEKTIGETLDRIFNGRIGRIIVATFASNIHRMQQIINASVANNRRVVFSGRSMENVSAVAIELGYLNIPDGYKISIDEMENYNNDEITIITTGSQGEAMAGLARIAFDTHKKIKIKNNDLFIISASPIPGNDKLISKVINQLYRKGAEVIYKDLEAVHVSGHAYQEELKLIHTLVHPKFFMPVHGEYRHLVHHKNLAAKLGMKKENIFILDNGEVLELNKKAAKKNGKVRVGTVYVDGIGDGDVGNIDLRDRKYLAENGMMTIVIGIDKESKSIVAGPDIITRGFIYAREATDLIDDVKAIVLNEVEKCLENDVLEWSVMKSRVKKAVDRHLYVKLKRGTSIFPIIVEV
ncbi:MAG: ribonuclease J, partial [Peptostreptococcaceae bacterium]|nr:ribonuclease J [Peptostreptococcaceae bacterium]